MRKRVRQTERRRREMFRTSIMRVYAKATEVNVAETTAGRIGFYRAGIMINTEGKTMRVDYDK